MQDYREFLQEILVSEEALQKRIAELGVEISRDYAGQDLLLVCILRGGVLFLADLMRNLTIPHTVDFMSVSSYGVGARQSRGQSRINLDLNTDIRERNVLLVEDIVDSGHTIKAVMELLGARQPRSLKVCTLLDKAERREVDVPIHYRGFIIPDKFVFGYGLDADEYYRNLPFIGVLSTDRYHPEA
ncbi:MAG TPA: hypoxanthine phosphoribosyltransferase [Anaerolineales bacterium]|nr:hypoxanthine phosphoribosyltransferase [Anaerolineales bacterium]